MNSYPGNWLRIILYSLLIGAGLALGWLAAARMVASIDYRNSDFVNYYLAGWMTLQGQDPYSTKAWIAGHQSLNATWIPNPIFPYPLPLATLVAPLGLLNLYNAFVTWVLLSAGLIFVTLTSLLTRKNNRVRAEYLLPLLAGAFLFRPTLVTFHDGQLGAFLLFIIGCVAILWRNGRWFLGGMLLGLVMVKPSVGFPLIGFIGVWLIFQRHLTALAGLSVSGLCLALIGFARDSNWPADFLRNGNEMLNDSLGFSPTLWGMSGAACQYQEECIWLFGGLLVVVFSGLIIYYLWVKRDALDPLAVVGVAAAAAVMITPYIWAYDQILVLLAVIATINTAMRNNNPYLAIATYPILLAALSAALVLVALSLGRDHWSALVPLLCLTVMFFVNRNQSNDMIIREAS